ncbi:MAG: universal stress protein [Chloroflexi bacterium]|nr:universal stress protein [Chloroflexota bacterium]
MFNKVLVPLDGSALAEGIMPYVEEMGVRLGSEVTLFHVVDPDTLDSHDPEHRVFIEQLVSKAQTRAEDYIRRVVRGLKEKKVAVQTDIAVGRAAEEVVRKAEEGGYDLVAMSTHGRSGVGRWVFGSVADRVLHATKAPVLLIRPDKTVADGLFRRVVVPLDGSELAEAALPFAEELAGRLRLPVGIVQAVQYLVGTEFGLYVEDPRGIMDAAAKEYLDRVAERIRGKGLQVEASVLWGIAGDRILEFAESRPGTIIVMSSHGRSGVGRWVFGSVADKLVRGAAGPVLVIRSRSLGR